MNPAKYLEKKVGGTSSREHERRIAARMGGRVVSRSGAGRRVARATRTSETAGGKGDVSTEMELIEGKTTSKASASIKMAHLIKITREARCAMRSPAMAYAFENMPPDVDRDWVLVPMSVWEKLRANTTGRVRPDSGGA